MTFRYRFVAAIFVALSATLLFPRQAARADSQDIAAVSRSVVRVALVAARDGQAYFVGHGSGVVVAPDKVLTNAHVVGMTRDEGDIVIGIIPPQGGKSYGGKVVAYSPGNDLALVQIEGGRLDPATFFAGAAQDGQEVVAIGYPGTVDRAQGMNLSDIVEPISPVKTTGTVSTGRSSKQFDTILHTAQLAEGSSGGPLVDSCGRILGINSFGSTSDTDGEGSGGDPAYGFAVSDREIASFLRQAGIQVQRTIVPCRSMADVEAADREAAQKAQLEADRRAAADAANAHDQALRARDGAEQAIITARENWIAVAALLLALSIVAAGAGGLMYMQQKPCFRWPVIAGTVLLVGAIAAFFMRPGFDEVDDRAADILKDAKIGDGNPVVGDGAETAANPAGDNICHIDLNRSRVTVSDTADIPFNWTESGCVNGRTQFARTGSQWSRVLVPNGEAAVSIRSFDPSTSTYRSDRYAVDAATADAVRNTRKTVSLASCTTDPAKLDDIVRMETDVRGLLPAEPNERLIYHCTPGKLDTAP